MHQADHDAGLVLARLQDRFCLPTMPLLPMPAAAGVLVGFEVEVPWSAYFPDLWRKYFLDGRRKYEEMERGEQEALSAECSLCEATLLPRLEATQACGIKRGRDRYWEFVLPPVYELSLAAQILETLGAAMLMPYGAFSLHATISGISSRRDALLMLLLIELLFGRKERITQGCQGLGGWARKGDGGVVVKIYDLLYDAQLAYELRSLELPAGRSERKALVRAIAKATHCFSPEARADEARTKAWGSPRSSPDIWQTYLERYESLRANAQEIGLELGLIDERTG
jgi:hypothetical protein